MKNKQFLAIILMVVLAFAVASCNRSSSTPPPGEETVTQEFEIPGTEQAIGQLSQYATQTAMALNGESVLPEEGEEEMEEPSVTPEPEEAEDTPEPTVAPTATATEEPAGEVKESYDVPNKYTLQKGEFPYCIARRFDLNPTTLLNTNNLARGSQVFPGTVLTIPSSGGSFPGQRALKSHPTTHTVVAGETIYTISCTYGDVDPRAIIDANNLEEPYSVSAGDKLQIP